MAVAVIKGGTSATPLHRTLQFSGYEWTVRASPGARGGYNEYDFSNAWTAADGALHMRITGEPGKWSCAQVILNRSLGYSTYRLTVRDTSGLDPAAVFAMYTLSDAGAAAAVRNPREWDVEISRWGEPSGKNARYLLQPAYLGQNTVWFSAPPDVLSHQIRWEAGSVRMTTIRGEERAAIADHVFSSGIPVPGERGSGSTSTISSAAQNASSMVPKLLWSASSIFRDFPLHPKRGAVGARLRNVRLARRRDGSESEINAVRPRALG